MDKLKKYIAMKSKEDSTFLQREGLLGVALLLISIGVEMVTGDKWYVGLALIILGLGSYVYRVYLKK
jgi:hypothetical protein